MPYSSEHGDTFLYGDKGRQQLGFNVHGVNFSSSTNSWYLADGSTTSGIGRGYVVAITGNTTVSIADQNSITTIVGFALNSVAATAPITLSSNCTTTSGLYTIASTASSGQITGIATGMLVVGSGIPNNTKLMSISGSSGAYTFTLSNPATASATVSLTFGLAIEVAEVGPFIFYNASTDVPTAAFSAAEAGSILYLSPGLLTSYQNPGTQGTNPQLTTSRSLAATSGNPLIQVGLVSSTSSMDINIGGDVKGTTGLTQITANAGEPIQNTGSPVAISMGSDGNVYVADRRKGYSKAVGKLSVTANSCGAQLSDFINPLTSIASFTVLSTSGNTNTGGTLTWNGGASGAPTITVSANQTPAQIATAIAGASLSGSTWAGAVITAIGSQVVMKLPSNVVAPTIALGSATLIYFSPISFSQDYSSSSQLTVKSTAGTTGTLTINGVTTASITSGSSITVVGAAIATAFSGNATWNVSNNAGVVTFVQIADPNRNIPIGLLTNANAGYTSGTTVSSGTTSLTSYTWTSMAFAPELGVTVAIASNSGNPYYSYDGSTWTVGTGGTLTGLSAIAWSGTRFSVIAAGSTSVLTSTDGKAWTLNTTKISNNTWTGLAWSPSLGKFVACCSGANVDYSSDGITYTSQAITGTNWTSIVWAAEIGKFVMVSSNTTNNISYSTTGTTVWTTVSGPAVALTGIAYNSAYKVLSCVKSGAANNKFYYSYDGINWVETTTGTTSHTWTTIIYSLDRNIFLAFNSDSTATLISSDGRTWSTGPTLGSSGTYKAALWLTLQSKFVAIAQSATNSTLISFSGLIPATTPCIIQKIGTISSSIFGGLTQGQPIYLDILGAVTSNPSAFSFYTDITSPIGFSQSASSVYVNIGYNSQKSDSNPVGSIIACPSGTADYGWILCNGATVSRTTYSDLFSIVGTTWGVGDGSTTFQLPPTTTVATQIKYSNWYYANPPQAPNFRFDSGWTNWGSLPGNGCTGATPTSYIEVPVTAFSSNANISDIFAEVYVQDSSGLINYKIDPNPISYWNGGSNTYYGYQLQQDTTGYVRVNFATGGLAYLTNGNTYNAIDTNWKFRVFLYQTNRYNKFYDVGADQKLSQLWSLSLIDYTVGMATQGAGYFDRGSTAPSHSTRLNYDGILYTANEVISNTLTINGTSGTADIISGNATANLFNTTATTINIGNGATTGVLIGATSGTTTIKSPIVVGSQTTQALYNTIATTINFAGAATALNIGATNVVMTLGNSSGATTITNATGVVTANVFNTVATTVNAFGAATTLAIGAATGTATLNNATVTLANATAFNINGASPTVASTSTGTLTLFNTNILTVNAFGAATSLTIGSTTATATYNIATNATLSGNTKTINIGTGGATGSITNINLGSVSQAASVTINGSLSVTGTFTSSGSVSQAYAFIGPAASSGQPTFRAVLVSDISNITTTNTQLNYLNASTGTTGTTSTNLVFSTSPALTTPTIVTSITLNADANFIMTSGLGTYAQTYANTSATPVATLKVMGTTITRSGAFTSATENMYGQYISITRSNTGTFTAVKDYGVYATVSGVNIANQTVYGGYLNSTAVGTTATASYGLYSAAAFGTTAYGIWAQAVSGTTNWAGWFRGTSGIRIEQASTQDAIAISGRAGGTSSYTISLVPATLSSSTTLTLPNITDTLVTLTASQALTNKSLNGMTVTASTGTFTLTNAKTLSVANSLNFSGTDASDVIFYVDTTIGAAATYTGSVTLTSNGTSATIIRGPNGGTAVLQTGTAAITGNPLSQFATTSSAQLYGIMTVGDTQGTGKLVFATSPTLSTPTLTNAVLTFPGTLTFSGTANGLSTDSTALFLSLRDANGNLAANSFASDLLSTATAGGTTTLTVSSERTQIFTGTLAQTIKLPVTTTTGMILGREFLIINNSTGNLTVQTGGAVALNILPTETSCLYVCSNISVDGASSWQEIFNAEDDSTNIRIQGSSTGYSTLTSANSSSSNYILTFPAITDTIATIAAAQTFTNKTYDTAGTGNVFKINGTTISAKTGSGAVVLATSPEIATSITTASTSFSLLDTTATTVNAFGAATTMGLGSAARGLEYTNDTTPITNLAISTTAQTINIGSGVVTTGLTKTINIGTAGASGSITNINIGSATSGSIGTTIINGATAVKISKLTTVGPVFTTASDGTLSSEQYLAVSRGGTGVGTFTLNGILYGNTTSDILATAAGVAGEILTGTAGAPAWSSSPTLTTSLTVPTLLSAAAGTTVALYNTVLTSGSISMGGALVGGSINIANGTATTTATVSILSGAAAGSSTRVLNLGANGAGTTTTTINIGTGVTGTAGNINIGTTSKSTTTINGTLTLGTDLTVPNGGTGAGTFTQYGVIYGNAANALGVTAAGVAGQVLVGSATAPAWSASPALTTSLTVPTIYGSATTANNLILRANSADLTTGMVHVTTTVASTSTTTGAFVVDGGVGIAGTVNATSFNATSKRSYKENITPFTNSALALIKDIDVVNFNFIKDARKERHVGFIADDTNELFSGVDHDRLDVVNAIGILLKAVQELTTKLEGK